MRFPRSRGVASRICCVLLALMLGPVSVAAPPALKVLTWSDYIDPEVVADFEAASGIRLDFIHFDSDETRDDYLVAANGSGYDLILVNGYSLRLYQQRGWVAPITPAEVPNLRHIDPKWLGGEISVPGYGVPYFWGTLGIAYRTDLVARPVTHWLQLFDPAPELHGRIAMIKNTHDLIGMALRARGHSVNSSDAQALAEARELLLRQKPHVKTYTYLSLDEDSALVTGEVWAAQMYSGDALMLQEFNPDIRYVVPEEGTNLWVDFWTVAAQSANKAAAMKFIDYINGPAVAARNAEFVHYASPNLSANALLPASHHEDPVINPPAEVIERSEAYEVLPPRAARAWNALFAEIVN
jgi:spermidine/putrescine transport system substrate-binding protein